MVIIWLNYPNTPKEPQDGGMLLKIAKPLKLEQFDHNLMPKSQKLCLFLLLIEFGG